jgi:hypothetical protein
MDKAFALTRTTARIGAGYARVAVVFACASALILAGQALPF